MMRTLILGLMFFTAPMLTLSSAQSGEHASQDQSVALLTREQAAALMPATVFFRGKTAPIQARNSAGLRIGDGRYMLVAMVDTSGYSSAIQESYQAYLLNEVPLRVGTQTLQPGAYGVGFVAGDHFIVVDLGGKTVLDVASTRDVSIARPTPLQILADKSSASHFRLYSGRSYVEVMPGVAER